MKTKNKFIKTIACMTAAVLIAVSLAACGEKAAVPDDTDGVTGNTDTAGGTSADNGELPEAIPLSVKNLMENVTPQTTETGPVNGDFVAASADFALGLFRKSAAAGENTMISPLSVLIALSMTANGAAGETLQQMENVLGSGLTIDQLNEYLRDFTSSLTSADKARLTAANSVWFRDDGGSIAVNADFLQKNADYYHADAYGAAFDDRTVDDINSWVSRHTDGLIDGILDKIPAEAVMYLINAVVFDAEWEKVYTLEQVYDGIFHAHGGSEQTVPMMRSEETRYLDDGKATGFIKPYAGGRYSFAALLPNEDVLLEDYIASMTGESFLGTLSGPKSGIVYAEMPKFTSEYKIEMNGILTELGIEDAFSASLADFSKLGSSPLGNIFISSVLHKTYISVDELGTKAGAVTSVEMSVTSMPAEDIYTVTLDRPFVYAIIDNATNLPLFIGAVTGIA